MGEHGHGRGKGGKGLGKGGVEGLNNLVEGGLEELKLATEDVNPTQDSGVSVLLGERKGPRREVVELGTILDGGEGKGEIEMFHISELEDDQILITFVNISGLVRRSLVETLCSPLS